MSKFKLGQVVVTRGVNNEIADNEKFAKEIHTALLYTMYQYYTNYVLKVCAKNELKSNTQCIIINT